MADGFQAVVDRMLRYQASPGLYVRECLGAKPEAWQDDVLSRLEQGKKRIAIRSGHGVGKTTLEAWLALWFGATREGAKIPCTAPSGHQLHDLLWGEIGKWHRVLQERVPFMAQHIEIKAETVDFSLSRSFAYARTARKEKPEALQGFHADHLMFLIDEGSGIEEPIFEVAEGALSTPGAIVVMCGNPTRTTGYFHRAFTRDRERWSTKQVGCADSSRVSPDYIANMAANYGQDSNVYRVRVLGEFPSADDDGVIPLHLAEAAVMRDVDPMKVKPLWGLDVARFGDDASALAKRKGNVVTEPVKTWRNKDTMQVSGLVKAEHDATPPDQQPAEILVDVIGLGAGVVDRLQEMGLPARGVNVAEQPSVEDRYLRLRDELWFKVREWLDARACRLPEDEPLIAELTGPRYKVESSGKIKVESKDEMKKRGLKSPDRADALCLTFAGNATASHGNWGRGPAKSPNTSYVV